MSDAQLGCVPHRPALAVLLSALGGGLEASGEFQEAASRFGVPVELTPGAVPAGVGPWAALRPAAGGLALEPALPRALPADLAGFAGLARAVCAGQPVEARASQLVDGALAVWMRPGFETFVSLPQLRFQPYPHQLRAAATVLRRMRGRALLADEVGLGKTIEAGLVLSELFLRRLAGRCLILVPAGLVQQWAEELDRKFGLPVAVQGSAAWERAAQPWSAPGIVLASLAAVRRAPNAERAAQAEWDLVVIDEAHRVKNPQSASARLVKALRSRYLLLLTATPVENRLEDLFQLVQLVRPGYLGTPAEFRRRHGSVARTDVRDAAGLQQRMREVMVRHRRSEVEVMLPRRLAETLRVTPEPDEAALYAAVVAEVRRCASGASPQERVGLRALQRLAGSSPRALHGALERSGRTALARQAAAVSDTRKAQVLIELLQRHVASGDKVAVFTGFRDTLSFLAERVEAAGLAAACYHGALSRREKDAAIASFQGDRPILLTTEAAGEGRNLQFCHVLCNFDLPWNPMQIEQRLGRVHRIGQTEDVLVSSLVGRGTVEERVFSVLEAKIHLFELVVGELDMILGRVEDDLDFESFIFDAFTASADDTEFSRRLEQFGDQLAAARAQYLEGRARNDALLPDLTS